MIRSVVRRGVLALPPARRSVARARFGSLSRVAPLTEFGYERGTPVDRPCIARYLEANAGLVRGRVLEVKEDAYATALGAGSVDVVDIDAGNPLATVVGDLCSPGTLAEGAYDAAVVTQTLMLLRRPDLALQNLAAALRPGGALLLTVSAAARVIDDGDRWRWTPNGLAALLADAVPNAEVTVQGLGNGLLVRAFLFGLAAEDLDPAAYKVDDPAYPLIVGACVRRPL